MVRNRYIYLVKKDPSRHVLGAFTVKSEMIKALNLFADTERVAVWRYVDGAGCTLPSLLAEGLVKDLDL